MAAAEKEIVVPDIGDFKNVEVIEVLVKAGDTIKPEDPLITLESDKAAMDVPAPCGGVVKALKVKAGDRVSQGSPVLTLEVPGESEAAPAKAPVEAPRPEPPAVSPMPEPAAAEREVVVPDIGDFKNVEVIEVLVKAGDTIKPEDPLITLESDKAAMDVPAPCGGVVQAVKVRRGDRVSQGSPILTLKPTQPAGAAPAAAAPAAAAPVVSEPPPETRPAPPPAGVLEGSRKPAVPPHASPAVRRFARELGADLGRIAGTGPKGRILKEDVQRFVKASLQRADQAASGPLNLPPIPEIDFAQFGPIQRQPLSRIQKLSGPGLHRNWLGIPHVTHHDEADITELEAFRQSLKGEAERRGLKLTLLPFVMKAVVAALRAFPNFNASLAPDGEALILKRYFHLGVAVDTPEGLVVPVIREVDQKSILQLAQELAEVGERARGKKLRNSDLEGGCFTLSSLGGIGGTAFTPIINAPEVAILGLSRAKTVPVFRDGQWVPRLVLPLSLSYDHRVIDGAQAARFMVHLSGLLADLRRVLL
ncbi:dihydrolipoyllysine-residue acetyltransferase [Candidatus Methylocalor cossyra]|uniref:Acetyltransferase component of pyruvate dehydrogenase complex n=1 Tax=Candidatus Methylocalor cossyra TaxID=3108543 RepID=A0ABP1C9E2_9GAMM